MDESLRFEDFSSLYCDMKMSEEPFSRHVFETEVLPDQYYSTKGLSRSGFLHYMCQLAKDLGKVPFLCIEYFT